MIDNLKSKEELEVKKLKVTKADIVVKGNVDKPYYVIVYHEVGKDYDNEGFGSYYLENVFKWREEELEIVDGNEQPKIDWIPCEVKLPPKPRFSEDSYLVKTQCVTTPYTAYWNGEKWTDVLNDDIEDVIAWCPIPPYPQPYKKEGENDG